MFNEFTLETISMRYTNQYPIENMTRLIALKIGQYCPITSVTDWCSLNRVCYLFRKKAIYHFYDAFEKKVTKIVLPHSFCIAILNDRFKPRSNNTKFHTFEFSNIKASMVSILEYKEMLYHLYKFSLPENKENDYFNLKLLFLYTLVKYIPIYSNLFREKVSYLFHLYENSEKYYIDDSIIFNNMKMLYKYFGTCSMHQEIYVALGILLSLIDPDRISFFAAGAYNTLINWAHLYNTMDSRPYYSNYVHYVPFNYKPEELRYNVFWIRYPNELKKTFL